MENLPPDGKVVPLRRSAGPDAEERQRLADTIFADEDDFGTFSRGNLIPPAAGAPPTAGQSAAPPDPFFERLQSQALPHESFQTSPLEKDATDEYFDRLGSQSPAEMSRNVSAPPSTTSMPGSATLTTVVSRISRPAARIRGAPMSSIFISYRRDETKDVAGRLYDRLTAIFGKDKVFRDIYTIPGGADFPRWIEEAVASARVVVALIGNRWATIRDSQDRRRIDDPADWVRLEIATALERDTLVVPVLDEEENVGELYQQLTRVLDTLPLNAEIIFVDDGSKDQTFERLGELYERDTRVRVVSLRRNFGKTPALLAGFNEARGLLIVTLDGDLQDDPSELPRFLRAIDEGADLISGWKRVRHDPFTKTIPSRLFNLTVRWLTGIPLHDFNCGYKAYRREVLEELKLYGELHRFIPVLAYRRGFRIEELEVQHHPRRFGRSKFGAARLLKGLLDFLMVLFLTRYLQRPLQLFGLFGAALSCLGALGFVYLLVLKLLGQSVFQTHGPLLFLSGILLVAGVQLFCLGLVGEMLRHYAFQAGEEFSVKRRLSRN